MNRIYYLFGKSAPGKDTIYERLLNDPELDLKPVVGYTTRPMREGEKEGVEYHFTTEEEFRNLEKEGRVIESRVYHTVYGDWYYYNVFSEEIVPGEKNADTASAGKGGYLCIGTLESYLKFREYFGEKTVVPVYVEVEDGLRLERALARERKRENPGYAEMCRRFLTDSEDFSEEKLQQAGIKKRFNNTDIDECLKKIKQEISDTNTDG